MGRPMSKHLIDAGQAYWFRHRCHGAGSRPRNGVDVKDSIADAVRDADAVFTMLPAGTDVDYVMTCADVVFASIRSGTLVVDCSTIGIDYARRLHSAAEKVGATFVEAPVSGGTEGAIAGTLTFMTGGTEKGCAEIETACQLTDQSVNDLRRALETLTNPASK